MGRPGRRGVLAAVAGAFVAGCGYAPALAPGRPAAALAGAVRADDPADRRALAFVQRLEERLGRPGAGAYRLAYTIETLPQGRGITPEGTTTRIHLTGSVAFALSAPGAGAPLRSGREESFTAYSTTATAVATLVAEEAAEARLMHLLADRVVARLLAWGGPA
ncbi:MAG: hypothetical protein IT545_14940 [Rhodobacteraceae bacterium]|nr:hypothetical protein [Paracoccaceae bacterium]